MNEAELDKVDMEKVPIEDKLRRFADKLATDHDYASIFRGMSAARQAQELIKEGFTHEEIGALVADPEPAKAISLDAGRIWSV